MANQLVKTRFSPASLTGGPRLNVYTRAQDTDAIVDRVNSLFGDGINVTVPGGVTASTGTFTTKAVYGAGATEGFGLYTTKSKSAKTTFAGGATENIAVAIPSGAVILGASLRVDVAIVFGGTGVSWSATYNTGATQAIGAIGQLATKNTTVNAFFNSFAATPITSAVTNITITPNLGTLTSGAITAVVYYSELTSLTNAA